MGRIYRSYLVIATCYMSIHTQPPQTFADACSAIRCNKVIAHAPGNVLDKADTHGNTLLHYAVNYQRPHTTFFLLQYLSPNVSNHDGHTPLHVALSLHDTQLTRMLLKHGATAGRPGPSGDLPMHYAIQARIPELVRTIASLRPSAVDIPGENTDPTLASSNETPIHRAIHVNNGDALRELISHDAHTGFFDTYGRSYLYYACKWDRPVIARMLYAYIDINTPDYSGNYPIHHAVETDNPDMISHILTQSPDASSHRTKATDERITRHSVPRQIGNTPLHLVRSPHAIDTLATHSRNIIPYNKADLSPVAYAVRKYLRPEQYPDVSPNEVASVIQEFVKRGAVVHDHNAITHMQHELSAYTEDAIYHDDTMRLIAAAVAFNGSRMPEAHGLQPPQTPSAQRAILYHAETSGYTPYTCGTRFQDNGRFIANLRHFAHEQHDAHVLNIIRTYQQQDQLEKLQNSSYFCDINILIS